MDANDTGQPCTPAAMTDSERAEMRLYVDWVEKHALESLRFHTQSSEVISKEANTTLALYLSGAGAALAGAVSPTWACMGLLVKPSLALLALGLFGCAAYLLHTTLSIREIDVPTNSPGNLLEHKNDGWDRVRLGELRVIESKIERVAKRNKAAGVQLNGTRRVAVACAAAASLVVLVSLTIGNLSALPGSCRSEFPAGQATVAANSDR